MKRCAVLTLLAALVLAGAPAARAATYCDQFAGLCVSAITYSPSTVANTADTSVTITITGDGGKRCLSVELPKDWVGPANPYATLTETSTAGVYRGTFTVLRGARTGTSPLVGLQICNGNFADANALAAAGFGQLTVTGRSDVTPPELVSLTMNPASPVDVTKGPVSFPVSARITDAGAGSDGAQLLVYPHDPQPESSRRGEPVAVPLTRTAGTRNDGTFTGTATMPGGTAQQYDVQVLVGDRLDRGRTYASADLAARGLTSTVRTRTTAAPATPTGLTVVTTYVAQTGKLVASAHWNTQPNATEFLVTTSGNCVADPMWPYDGATANRKPAAGAGFCTVTVRASNAFGSSAGTVSGSAFI